MIIALLGMLAIGLSFISGLGIGAAAVVAVTVIAAITLLPAMLGFVGNNIDRSGSRGSTPTTARARRSGTGGAGFVQRHAGRSRIAGLAVVLALALPVLSLRLGFVDAGNDPAGTQTRQAYDLVAKGFGPGSNGPFLIAIQLPAGGDHTARRSRSCDADLAATPGVASVSPPLTSPSGTTAVIRLNPTTAPQDVATSTLLHHLRHDVIPQATAGTGVHGVRRRVQRA